MSSASKEEADSGMDMVDVTFEDVSLDEGGGPNKTSSASSDGVVVVVATNGRTSAAPEKLSSGGGGGVVVPFEVEAGPSASSSRSEQQPQPADKPRRPVPYVYALASIAALNSANLGYDLGVMSGAAQYIQEDMNLKKWQLELLIGSLNGCAIGGAAIAHVVIDTLGRRATFACSCVGFILGVSGMALAPNYWVLLACRVVTGIGVGVGFAIDPVYIAEVAPASARGELVTWSEIAINVGIVAGFVASFAFRDLSTGLAWRVMLGCGVIAPIILLICVVSFMPESPRWLVMKDKEDEAKVVLKRLTHEDEDPETLVTEIRDAVEREKNLEGDWRDVWRPATPGIERSLFVGVGVAAAQQMMAEESLLFYVTFILEDLNVNRTMTFYALITMGVLKTVCIVISACFLDNRGRRPMLLISIAGMGLALSGISGAFYWRQPLVIVACIWGYMAFFSLGIGPVCWLLAAEVFPLAIRAKAMALATIANRVVSTVIASTFFTWADVMTPSGYFAFFALVAAGIWGTVYTYLPETKGKSLEEMAAYFESCVPRGAASGRRGISTKRRPGGGPRARKQNPNKKRPPSPGEEQQKTTRKAPNPGLLRDAADNAAVATSNPIFFRRAFTHSASSVDDADDDDEHKDSSSSSAVEDKASRLSPKRTQREGDDAAVVVREETDDDDDDQSVDGVVSALHADDDDDDDHNPPSVQLPV